MKFEKNQENAQGKDHLRSYKSEQHKRGSKKKQLMKRFKLLLCENLVVKHF